MRITTVGSHGSGSMRNRIIGFAAVIGISVVSILFVYQDWDHTQKSGKTGWLPVPIQAEGRRCQCDSNPSKDATDEETSCLANYYRDILLVIVYNHAFYDSASSLREFYHPVFPNIFFCGPSASAKEGVESVRINKGIWGYECLGLAIRKKPGFKGYFFISDDVILNYWNLYKSSFDLDKVWISNNQFGKADLSANPPNNWYWWMSPYGLSNCRSAVNEIFDRAVNFTFFEKVASVFIKNNRNGNLCCFNGRSDIFYVNGEKANQFEEISKVFHKYGVFLEIAVPTIVRFLSAEEDLGTLNGIYLPGDVRKGDPRVIDSRYFWTTYLRKSSSWFIHPFKLHHYQDHNRDLNMELMKAILIRKTQDLTRCGNADSDDMKKALE